MTEFDFESLRTPAPGSAKASRRVATQIRREILPNDGAPGIASAPNSTS